jgi:SRSO17 transposase
LNCLYHAGDVSIPVAFEPIRKPVRYCDLETRREKRRAEVTKNELVRSMIDTCVKNRINFRWVLFDSWYGSAENMRHIKTKHGKEFVGALKSNRLVALSEEDRKRKRFVRVDRIEWKEGETVVGWPKGLDFPVRLARQVFTNKDGSVGILYLACGDLAADWNAVTTIYQKRWKVEVFHKSLKSNAALAKSPARRPNAQSNHIFASIVAVFKMECLKIRTKLNHFALRSKLYLKAVRSAFDELQELKNA